MAPMFPTEISKAIPTARLDEGAMLFAAQLRSGGKPEYIPPATGNKNAYVTPG